MKDIQVQKSEISLKLNWVGVSDFSSLFKIDNGKKKILVECKIDFQVSLSERKRAIHMSRLIEIIQEYQGELLTESLIKKMLVKAKKRLEASSSRLLLSFNYYLNKKAFKSKKAGLMRYGCFVKASLNSVKEEVLINVEVPVILSCPCSKAISKYKNTHNQRAFVKVEQNWSNKSDINRLITLVEREASSDIYSTLKRVDEKEVTEKLFEKPRFVEDIVRGVSEKLREEGVRTFKVTCESLESIHNHNAYAEYEVK